MSRITIDDFEHWLHWLKRSEDARTAGGKLNDPCAKEQMLGIAESYQRRAHCDWGHPTPQLTSERIH